MTFPPHSCERDEEECCYSSPKQEIPSEKSDLCEGPLLNSGVVQRQSQCVRCHDRSKCLRKDGNNGKDDEDDIALP